jgi:hypothetical protein
VGALCFAVEFALTLVVANSQSLLSVQSALATSRAIRFSTQLVRRRKYSFMQMLVIELLGSSLLEKSVTASSLPPTRKFPAHVYLCIDTQFRFIDDTVCRVVVTMVIQTTVHNCSLRVSHEHRADHPTSFFAEVSARSNVSKSPIALFVIVEFECTNVTNADIHPQFIVRRTSSTLIISSDSDRQATPVRFTSRCLTTPSTLLRTAAHDRAVRLRAGTQFTGITK